MKITLSIIILAFFITSTTGCSSSNNKEVEGAVYGTTMLTIAAVTAPLWGPHAIANTLIPDKKKIEININIGVGDSKNKVESLLGLPQLKYSCSTLNYEVWEYDPPLIEKKYRYLVFNNEGNLQKIDYSWKNHDKCKPNNVATWDVTKFSKLFIYRTNPAYDRYNPEKPFIYIDDNKIGKLGNGQVISTLIKAGTHTVIAKSSFLFMPFGEVGKFKFNAETNKGYFIRYDDSDSLSFELVTKDFYLMRK